jgi:hypothetical protein
MELHQEGFTMEMNLVKKEHRRVCYQFLIANRYWLEQKVMGQYFEPKYCQVGPVFLARLLKKIGLDMGPNGAGRFDNSQLRKSTLMNNPLYRT